MELTKALWAENDKSAFLSYLHSFQLKEKEVWGRNILNTKLELLCIPTKTIYNIVDEIFKGNYPSFLALEIFDNYEAIAIYGKIISLINDFDEMALYLNKYILVMENWAHCDLLSFNIGKHNKDRFLALSDQYLKDDKTFVRRLGLMILLQMVKDESMLPIIFHRLYGLNQENEYYVIMMAGWLLSECIIRYKNQTLQFISNTKDLNKKIVNKGIQKSRESRRLSQIEKDQLLPYKR
ncbi:MAG: DNA alkylation repair protein [Acholeplasmataceae bacterium]|nr:DNA alkylation repair protein [Acholeplasmataceae bacterium]